jgi:hypothetical protein
MADVDVAADQIAAHNVQLAAAQVKTVRFAEDLNSVDVISDGTAAVYYTLNGSTPAVAGSNCYLIPAGAIGVDTREPPTSGPTLVKLISEGTPVISVQRGD